LSKRIINIGLLAAVGSSLYGVVQISLLYCPRAEGFYSHSLTSGNNWALSLILAYSLLIAKLWDSKKEMIFYIFTTIVTAIGILSSGSKGPLIYSIIIITVSNLIFLGKRGVFITLIIILSFTLGVIKSDTLQKRFYDIYKGFDNPYTSTGNRVVLWKHSLTIIKENIFFGIGSNFKKEIQKKVNFPLKWKSHPHNAYLSIAVNNGIPALIALIMIFISIYSKLLKVSDKNSDRGKFAIIAILFLTLYLMEGITENNFSDSEVKIFFWFTIGLLYNIIFFNKGNLQRG